MNTGDSAPKEQLPRTPKASALRHYITVGSIGENGAGEINEDAKFLFLNFAGFMPSVDTKLISYFSGLPDRA
jgi:hypothetical protein